MVKKQLSGLTDDEVFVELENRRVQLEFGEEDDVDAARAKLKEWVLESGYDENYEFNIEDTINDAEEFSDDGTDEKEETMESETVEEKSEEADEKVEEKADEKPEEKEVEKPEEKTEEVTKEETEEKKVEEEKKNEDELMKRLSDDEEEVEGEPSEENDGNESNVSNDIFKEAATGVINGEADVLELDYGEDDLEENKQQEPPAAETQESTPQELVSMEPPSSMENPLAKSKMIWISNLPKETKANQIKEAYEGLGYTDPIVTCKIAVNKKSGSAFGFVELLEVEQADKMMKEFNGNELCGNIVEIKKVERDPTLPKPKDSTSVTTAPKAAEKRKSEGTTLLVPKRTKKAPEQKPAESSTAKPVEKSTVINLKEKAQQRAKQDEKRDLDRLKRDLKEETSTESRLRRDKDDMKRKLRRKRDEADDIRRQNGRLRDQLRQVENQIRTEEGSRSRLKEDIINARRNLDRVMAEMRQLDSTRQQYNSQEDEQRRRIQMERERLEAEKRRFAEERAQLERERRERGNQNYHQNYSDNSAMPPHRDGGNFSRGQTTQIVYRSTGMNPNRGMNNPPGQWAKQAPVQVTTYQQPRWPDSKYDQPPPERKVFSYSQYGGQNDGRR